MTHLRFYWIMSFPSIRLCPVWQKKNLLSKKKKLSKEKKIYLQKKRLMDDHTLFLLLTFSQRTSSLFHFDLTILINSIHILTFLRPSSDELVCKQYCDIAIKRYCNKAIIFLQNIAFVYQNQLK